MRKSVFYISIIIAGALMVGCEKPYAPSAVTTNPNLLVVEGVINTGADSTIIKLSRTVAATNNKTTNPETKAAITIENTQGTIYTLTETVKGTYAAPPLNLDNTKQYRIRIKTNVGKTYLSDLVNAKVTPGIDSVGFIVKNGGVQIYANTHDASNNTHYYKYNYQETWQFHTKFYTGYISDGKALIPRTADQNINYCFAGAASATTILNSTASLSQDVAYQAPVAFIDGSSEKLQVRYSILVIQQALDKDAYTYWDNVRKNSDDLGGLFSTQPTQLTGNIHNIADANEQVLGYISAGTTQKKRIFIDVSQLPSLWTTNDIYGCRIDSAFSSANTSTSHPYAVSLSYLIELPPRAYAIDNFKDPVLGSGYTYSSIPCTDCRTRGTLVKPSFWK